MLKLLLLAGASVLLASCASIPQPLTGQYAALSPQNAVNGSGQRVRWGGTIVNTVPEAQQTCIYALSRPLDAKARPSLDDKSAGRFVACHAGFYDPEIFAPGREITVAGTLDGTLTRKVGEYDYPYPRVAADVIYLWPRRPVVQRRPFYPPPYYNPFWRPFGWGTFGPSRVIFVPVHHPSPPPDSD